MKLLPCPFCGGTSVTVEEGTTYRWAVATCADCDATASEVRAVPDVAKTQELALAEWNRRASPELAAELRSEQAEEDRKDAERWRFFCSIAGSTEPNEHFDGLPTSPTKAQLDAAIDTAMEGK